MSWWLFAEIIYLLVIIGVSLRIIHDTQSVNKSVSYLLLVLFLPVIGILIYFTFGVNYRHRKMYNKKLIDDEKLEKEFKNRILFESNQILKSGEEILIGNKPLARLLLNQDYSPLTRNNTADILVNGEEKYPRVKEELLKARHHIHMEYYIFEPDTIGTEIAEILMQKAREGVEVRLIYDDFGSRRIRRKMVHQLREAGVKAMPFYKIKLIALANQINYRNHRKIIVVDGETAFLGGINVSDDYINDPTHQERVYWRDVHLYMSGPVVRYLQFLFMRDWNFCANDNLKPSLIYFPKVDTSDPVSDLFMQIAASGPDSDSPTILYSILQAIMLAKEEILITTPYFIPGESLKDLLIVAAKGGVAIHLLVPGKGDSWVVNSAAHSYYLELLRAGVKIYRYMRGFVHSKTMVVDREIVMVGTANMDIRSFDLNFEVNAVIYNKEMALKMREIFLEDVNDSLEIELAEWENRPAHIQLMEKVARLVSPLL